MSYWKHLRQRQKLAQIEAAAKDLLRKELVPKYTTNYILDNLKADAHNCMIDRVKSTSCPICGINLPSRFLMRQHVKIHGQAKDNDPFVVDTKPYFS